MNKEAGIWIVAIIILIGGGWYLYRHAERSPEPEQPAAYANIFTDATDRLSFGYPDEMFLGAQQETTSWSALSAAPGRIIAVATLPRSYIPGTNFSEARFSVGLSQEQSAIASCLTPENGASSPETVVINGHAFAKIVSTDAGAGNIYKTTSYRTVRDGACYAVEYTIHSTNIGNYPPEAGITEFDAVKIEKTLEGVAASFQFLP